VKENQGTVISPGPCGKWSLKFRMNVRVCKNHLLTFLCLNRVTLLIAAEHWQFSGSLTPMAGAVHLCYYQKAGESMQWGVEMEGSLRTQECTATVGYQIDLPKSNLIFRGLYTYQTF